MITLAGIPGERFFAQDTDEGLELFLAGCILLFVLIGVGLLCWLLYSRGRKNRHADASEGAQPEIENALLRYLFEETDLSALLNEPAIRAALRRKKSSAVLLAEVLKLHSNFSGAYAARLEEFYKGSRLRQLSLARLKSRRWHIRCSGIGELAQMNARDAYATIEQFTRSKNAIVRRQAQMAVLRLEGFGGLKFLDGYTLPISEWEQLNYITLLAQAPAGNMPDFSAWLDTENESLRIFALRLIAEFGQNSAVANILARYRSFTEPARLVAVETLCRLHAAEGITLLLDDYQTASPKLRAAILSAIGNVGSMNELDFLVHEAQQESYDLRFHAVKAIAGMTGSTAALASAPRDEELERIIRHINDKRIHA